LETGSALLNILQTRGYSASRCYIMRQISYCKILLEQHVLYRITIK